MRPGREPLRSPISSFVPHSRGSAASGLDLSLAFWHLAGFVAPAFGVATITAGLAKLVWRRELAAVRWWRLTVAASAAGTLVLVAGLVGFGHDGKMTTYAAMVVACAGVLWWIGFGRGT